MKIRKFKYQINHIVSIQPRHVTINGLALTLKEMHNIPPHVFDRERRVLVGESYEIPEERLKVYAQLLNVSVQALVEENAARYALKIKKVAPIS